MELVPLADLRLRYTALQSIDFAPGGQLYGVMEGSLMGERLSGDVHLTNLAARRPDDVNMPILRGVLTTHDGASVWIELDGVATLREADAARVFVTSCRFRTGDPRLAQPLPGRGRGCPRRGSGRRRGARHHSRVSADDRCRARRLAVAARSRCGRTVSASNAGWCEDPFMG